MTGTDGTDEKVFIASCSFCHKPNTEVAKLVAGHGVYICDECVALSAQIIADNPVSVPYLAPWELEMPLEQVLGSLGAVAKASAQADRNLASWVDKARSLGATWAQVGGALGVSRQSAWERFAPDD